MEEKECKRCNSIKSLELFHNNRSTKDGKSCYCKECMKNHVRKYNRDNRELINLKQSTEEHLKYRRFLYQQNREKILEQKKIWCKNNRNKINIYKREYKRIKVKTDPLYHTEIKLRERIRQAFKRTSYCKSNGTTVILGCDYFTAFNYLESLFKENMSWDNRSEWHIDHIVPLSSATTEEELIKLCHYTNLQPLWAEDNLKKGSKLTY